MRQLGGFLDGRMDNDWREGRRNAWMHRSIQESFELLIDCLLDR